MLSRLLADLVLLAHLGFVGFVLGGGLLALRWRRAPWLHLPALAWGLYIELSGGVCPLTPIENALRRAGGQAGYAGGFVEHYVVPLLYPAALSPRLQLALATALGLVNALVYALVLWRRRAAAGPGGADREPR